MYATEDLKDYFNENLNFLLYNTMGIQHDKTKPGMVRAEYIEVEPNVHLHNTDAGDKKNQTKLPENA